MPAAILMNVATDCQYVLLLILNDRNENDKLRTECAHSPHSSIQKRPLQNMQVNYCLSR